MATPHPKLLFGGAMIGAAFEDAASAVELLRVLKDNQITHIDTAARYPPAWCGGSETLLGEAQAARKVFTIDTKILVDLQSDGSGEMAPAAARKSIEDSLKRLGVDSVETLYIHRPDPATPLVDQARVLTELHREGKFRTLGLSNCTPEGLSKFLAVCDEDMFVKPTVYQDNYSLIECKIEDTHFAILRQYGVSFRAYRALSAGFLNGNFVNGAGAEGTRFSDRHSLGAGHQRLFGNDKFQQAYQIFTDAIAGQAIQPIEAALRWMVFHSKLEPNDGVILGASKTSQVEENAKAISKGPLPPGLVEKLNKLRDFMKE